MKKFRLFGIVAAVGALLIASALYAIDRTARLVESARDAFCGFALGAVRAVAPKPAPEPVAQVQKVQAKSFQARIEKRERPVVTSSWRMCQST